MLLEMVSFLFTGSPDTLPRLRSLARSRLSLRQQCSLYVFVTVCRLNVYKTDAHSFLKTFRSEWHWKPKFAADKNALGAMQRKGGHFCATPYRVGPIQFNERRFRPQKIGA